MKKLILLALSLSALNTYAACANDGSQAVTILKGFDKRVSEQSYIVVNDQAVSLGSVLQFVTRVCTSSLTLKNPQDGSVTTVSFSKRGATIYANAKGKSRPVQL